MATMKNRVLWQEGMFALPQHFQQQQRHNDAMLRERLDALGDFAWGFTELSLNTELLAQGKVMIDRRRAVCRTAPCFVSLSRICCRSRFSHGN